MLAITVRLVHGTIRTGSPDDTVITGSAPTGEWPPSPARLFSALVAADGTGDRCRVTDGSELLALEQLDPPLIIADDQPMVTTLVDRFVVRDETKRGEVQDYPARVAARIHPGVRYSPETPTVTYLWDDVDPAVIEPLQRRASRIPYFGCADSPAHVTVEQVSQAPPGVCWSPVGEGGVTLPVPYQGFVEALDALHHQWAGGAPARRSWVRTVRQGYATGTATGQTVEPTLLHVRFDRPVIGRHARVVTETLRAAVIDHGSRAVGNDAVPWQVHGHGVPEEHPRPYQLVRYLALPNVGSRHSDGRIHGAALWIPPGTDPATVNVIREAVWSIERLHRPGWFDVAVSPHDRRRRPAAASPTRWAQPSTVYSSALPVVHERGSRQAPTADEVRRWFGHAGHPEPTDIQVSEVPLLEGAVWLRPQEVHGSRRPLYPYSWIAVRFDQPVAGPLCVGRARSLGMGLLAPTGDKHTRRN